MNQHDCIYKKRYDWLVKSSPINIAAIAYRAKSACKFGWPDVDKAVDAAIEEFPFGLEDNALSPTNARNMKKV